MLFVRILFVVLGLMMFYVGVLQSRVWRLSVDEPRYVRVGVGVLAASRLAAGVAFVSAGVWLVKGAVVAAAICLILGGVVAAGARRKLKQQS